MNRLRRACPQCRASGATWCTHDGPYGPQQSIRITPWWVPFVIVNRLEDLGGPMCEANSTAGIVPGFMRSRFVRQPQACGCHPPLSLSERFDRATEGAQGVLTGVGVIVVLASMGFIIHVLVIALFVVLTLALTGIAGVLAWKLRRGRRRELLPAPDVRLTAATRTVVTAATVHAIRQPAARGALYPAAPVRQKGPQS